MLARVSPRELLSQALASDLGNEAFGFRAISMGQIDLGYATVFGRLKGTYGLASLGLGILRSPLNRGRVYEDLMSAGAALGVVNCGYYARSKVRNAKAWKSRTGVLVRELDAGLQPG